MAHLLTTKIVSKPQRATEALSIRAYQLAECLKRDFDDDMSREIFAPNFFLDKPKRLWLEETRLVRSLMNGSSSGDSSSKSSGGAASESIKISSVNPENNLRGSFFITGSSGDKVEVYFTMTPEDSPRIQALRVTLLKQDKQNK
jgi:hypothetical protein